MNKVSKVIKFNGKNRRMVLGLEIKLNDEGRFSASGLMKFGWEIGGQCLDDMKAELTRLGYKCEKLNAILPYWKRWHLNDLRAGSPRQEKVVRERMAKGLPTDYDTMCSVLKELGLYEDKEFIYNGKPYEYGVAWLTEELPVDVKKGIEAVMEMPLEIKAA